MCFKKKEKINKNYNVRYSLYKIYIYTEKIIESWL